MITISALTPLNLQEEKAKFFADQQYNPQFIYSAPIPIEELRSHGLPRPEHLIIAQHILRNSASEHASAQRKLLQGRVLSESEVKEAIEIFLKLHQLEHRFTVSYSASYISRTSVSADLLRIRLPMEYRRRSLQGMLYHEIGTHALRRVNYEQQPWYRKKKQYGFSEYLETEEGLASLHSRLPHKNKEAITQALHYLSISTALKRSFTEVWHTIKPYTESLEQCWAFTLRAKRGISDTSKPGGYTKDILYLDGMIKVWRWLRERDFDSTQLYFGKMAIADVQKAVELNPDFKPILPFFFTKDRTAYATAMQEIGIANGFEQ